MPHAVSQAAPDGTAGAQGRQLPAPLFARQLLVRRRCYMQMLDAKGLKNGMDAKRVPRTYVRLADGRGFAFVQKDTAGTVNSKPGGAGLRVRAAVSPPALSPRPPAHALGWAA